MPGILDSCFVQFGTLRQCAPTEPSGKRTRNLTVRNQVSNRCATDALSQLEYSTSQTNDIARIILHCLLCCTYIQRTWLATNFMTSHEMINLLLILYNKWADYSIVLQVVEDSVRSQVATHLFVNNPESDFCIHWMFSIQLLAALSSDCGNHFSKCSFMRVDKHHSMRPMYFLPQECSKENIFSCWNHNSAQNSKDAPILVKDKAPVLDISHCIYKFTCICGSKYFGLTERCLSTRIKEHLLQSEEKVAKSAITKYLLDTEHSVDPKIAFEVIINKSVANHWSMLKHVPLDCTNQIFMFRRKRL